MARTCRACGGILGRDCFNEPDCMEISLNNTHFYESQIDAHYNQLQSEYYALIEAERKIEILTSILMENKIPIPDLSGNNLYYFDLKPLNP